MKIIILNARNRFRKEDLSRLDQQGAVFYEEKDNDLDSIKEFFENEEVVLGVQPDYIAGKWEGLQLEKLKQITTLKGICLSTTAYGWVPFKELGELGVVVTNVPGKSTDAVGEYYLLAMLSLLRKLPKVIKNNWQFNYDLEQLGTDAKNLSVGVVGLGKIGGKIADLCNGFGMKVSYWNRSQKQSVYQALSLEEIFINSDVVFVTVIADHSTKGMISNQMIDSMKRTAIFLSPIDPIVFDKEYILQKVASGELGGFGFETAGKTVVDYKGNVFAAPEIGYYTQQTIDKESQIMTDSMLAIADGKLVNVVNL